MKLSFVVFGFLFFPINYINYTVITLFAHKTHTAPLKSTVISFSLTYRNPIMAAHNLMMNIIRFIYLFIFYYFYFLFLHVWWCLFFLSTHCHLVVSSVAPEIIPPNMAGVKHFFPHTQHTPQASSSSFSHIQVYEKSERNEPIDYSGSR